MPESHSTTTHSQPARVPATRGAGPSALTFVHPASPFTAARSSTTRAEDFDALADLFLSDLTPAVALIAKPAKADIARSDGPGNPSPKEPRSHEPRPAANLTAHETPNPSKPTQSARIEAVLLGHLPVYAAAWAGQYARTRAAQLGGPVALLRVTGQWVRVELTGLPSDATARFAETGDLIAAIATATGNGRGQAAALGVLLCATASDEQRLVSAPAVQDITLLTGADEASTVAAYRVIKNIAHNQITQSNTAQNAAAKSADCRPGFRLVVAGCEQPAATAIWRRLADAARTFLGLELELAGSMPQISGAQSSTVLYDGPLTDSIADMLDMVQSCQRPTASPNIFLATSLATLTPTTAATTATIIGNAPSKAHADADAAAREDDSDDFFDAAADESDRIETARAVEALAAFTARTASAAAPAPSTSSPTPPPAQPQPTHTTATSPTAAGPTATSPAAAITDFTSSTSPAWLSALGLTSLGLPCPAAPAALIGRCDKGLLHIAALGGLTQAEHESAIVSLLRASAWCCEHRDMLCHLMGDGLIKEIATVGKPVLHLLSSSGPLARQSCIAGIDVSLLAPVPTGATSVAVSLTRSH